MCVMDVKLEYSWGDYIQYICLCRQLPAYDFQDTERRTVACSRLTLMQYCDGVFIFPLGTSLFKVSHFNCSFETSHCVVEFLLMHDVVDVLQAM